MTRFAFYITFLRCLLLIKLLMQTLPSEYHRNETKHSMNVWTIYGYPGWHFNTYFHNHYYYYYYWNDVRNQRTLDTNMNLFWWRAQEKFHIMNSIQHWIKTQNPLIVRYCKINWFVKLINWWMNFKWICET